MKRLLLAVPLLLLAGQAQAQETYQFAASAAQAARVDLGRVIHNEQTCFAAGLALDCTQAQLTAANGTGTIYANSLAGRTAFIQGEWLLADFQSVLNEQKRWDTQKAKINWDALDQAGKNAVCAALSLPNGCSIY